MQALQLLYYAVIGLIKSSPVSDKPLQDAYKLAFNLANIFLTFLFLLGIFLRKRLYFCTFSMLLKYTLNPITDNAKILAPAPKKMLPLKKNSFVFFKASKENNAFIILIQSLAFLNHTLHLHLQNAPVVLVYPNWI